MDGGVSGTQLVHDNNPWCPVTRTSGPSKLLYGGFVLLTYGATQQTHVRIIINANAFKMCSNFQSEPSKIQCNHFIIIRQKVFLHLNSGSFSNSFSAKFFFSVFVNNLHTVYQRLICGNTTLIKFKCGPSKEVHSVQTG